MDWFDADVTILSYNVYLQFGRYAFLLHTLVGTWFLGKVWTTHLLRHPAIEMIFWTKTHQFNWVKPATKNTTKTLYYTPKQTLTCVFVRTRALLLCSSCTSLITPKQLSVLRQLVWNFTTSLTLLKKKCGHRTLSFLADLLMAHIPTKSCASSGHDRIHPVTISPSDHPVNPRTADSNGNQAPSSQLRCWSLRCTVAVHPGKEKTKHGQLVKRQKGFIERILKLSFPTKMLGTAWNSSAVRAWYTTPINSPIVLGITNTKTPHKSWMTIVLGDLLRRSNSLQ